MLRFLYESKRRTGNLAFMLGLIIPTQEGEWFLPLSHKRWLFKIAQSYILKGKTY